MELRELLDQYEFPGDDTDHLRFCADGAERDQTRTAWARRLKAGRTLDSYIPEPERAIDGAFLMPVEDVFSISVAARWSPVVLSGGSRLARESRSSVSATRKDHLYRVLRCSASCWTKAVRGERGRTAARYQA